MLYRTLKRMIERGQTVGLEEKIDIFFAANKLTKAEYDGLVGMLHPETDGSGGAGAPRPTESDGQATEEG